MSVGSEDRGAQEVKRNEPHSGWLKAICKQSGGEGRGSTERRELER